MRKLAKKIMIVAMIGIGFNTAVTGMVQLGINTAVAEASPVQGIDQHKIVNFDDRHDDQQKPIVPQPNPEPQPQPQPQPEPQPEPQSEPQPQPEPQP